MIKLNGRRGAFLLLWGLIFVAMGYALTIPLNDPPTNKFLHDYLPWWFRASLWGFSGLIAIVSAWIRDSRATITGYTFLSLPVGERLASCALSWLILNVDYRATILGSIVYGALLVAILLVASWPEPNPIKITSILPEDNRNWKRRWR